VSAEGPDARRRDAGDVVTSSRSANDADGPSPPRPYGLRLAGPLAALLAPYIPQRVCSSLAPCQQAWELQQSVNVILWRALSPHFSQAFYCGSGYGHVYCVALRRAPRHTVEYACGALRRAPCIHARLRCLAKKSCEKCGLKGFLCCKICDGLFCGRFALDFLS
jgi:hypothetical protein